MPSIAVIGSGVLLIATGGFAFLNPQRFYEIRQRGQTNETPQLSDVGKLKWQILDAVFVLLGVATVLYGFTM